MSLYVGYFELNGRDPFGLEKEEVEKGGKCENDCTRIADAISPTWPVLDPDSRLGKADPLLSIETMMAQGWKEGAGWNPGAQSPPDQEKRRAVGIWQIRVTTADDIQDRVMKGITIPELPAGQRLVDHRTNPIASTAAYHYYIRDRIAAAGYDLERGLQRYNSGPDKEDYAQDRLEGAREIERICGGPRSQIGVEVFRKCLEEKCDEIKDALERATRQ
jgi:hypothetical protein